MKSFLHPTLFIVLFLVLFGCVENQAQLWQQGATILNSVVTEERPLTSDEIGRGLKEALQIGTGTDHHRAERRRLGCLPV